MKGTNYLDIGLNNEDGEHLMMQINDGKSVGIINTSGMKLGIVENTGKYKIYVEHNNSYTFAEIDKYRNIFFGRSNKLV